MNILSQFSPVRAFPDYTGPYKVGSCDVEVPASDLNSPAQAPDDSIGTVSFRIFYPCSDDSSPDRPVRWIPSPQREYGKGYVQFMGASPTLASILSLVPQFLYMTKVPVIRNGKLLQPPTSTERWPVMVFSHGLGGSRNAYSHLCGSLASYGICVIAPDHRDNSAPISFIRATTTTEAKTLLYNKYSHSFNPEIYQARDRQLRIRLWELGLIHDAMVKMDLGQCPTNLDPNKSHKAKRVEVVDMFKGKMNLHEPGSIIWAGHSFGSATTVQFLKSVYYGPPRDEDLSEHGPPLYVPDRSSHLVKQITNRSISVLLDLWCPTLRSKVSRWLWDKPMPCFDTSKPQSPPAGAQALIAVESEAFMVWEGNMNDTKRVVSPHSPPPTDNTPWEPLVYYPKTSAHLSQSDFGILFPWVTGLALKTREPERLLRLNTRAILQALRLNDYEIAGPADIDLEHELPKRAGTTSEKPPALNDARILAGDVRDWVKVKVEPHWEHTSDGESEMHVEQDPLSEEVEEAEVLFSKTPVHERTEEEAIGITRT